MIPIDAPLAQTIVDRTMCILDCNVNVMDAHGTIIGSGDASRLGQMHDGALLALSQARTVEIDEAMASRLYQARPGINLPLRSDGTIVGVVGLTGQPDQVRHFGELVRMTAEMMLEQSRLTRLIARDTRQREELLLNLIRNDTLSPGLADWAQRLGLDLDQPRVVAVIEVDSHTLGVDATLAELQQLQVLLTTPERDNLIATVSLNEIVVLKPVEVRADGWNADAHRERVHRLLSRMRDGSELGVRIALGQYFPGPGGIARSYRTALSTLDVGRRRAPDERAYFYQDLMLPVLLDSLRDGWQADELRRPLRALAAHDPHGLLQRTLTVWLAHDAQPGAAARALHIHRNTLDYRLQRIGALCELDPGRLDDRLLLYVALQLHAGARPQAICKNAQ